MLVGCIRGRDRFDRSGTLARIFTAVCRKTGGAANWGCLSVLGDCDVGQPIMAAAAFQAASLFGEKSVFFKNKLHFGVDCGAASKGSCSHDWLPHIAVPQD